MAIALEHTRAHARNRFALWWVLGAVALITLAGGIYSVWLSATSGNPPPLPAAPPHAVQLSAKTHTDMLQGNFVVQTALFRSTDTPVALVRYYKNLLKNQPHQIGEFLQVANTVLPSKAPEALQNMPSDFTTSGAKDPYAANYLYSEYSQDQSDVGIAIDARNPMGPTLVYLEMMTSPGS